MPGDERKISRWACFLLVTLRLFIGWHLLYEGLWKLNSQYTSSPWSAEGYLKNSTGPMRTYFREMTGDPDDLSWLDYDQMVAKWDDWYARFVAHYPGATEASNGGRSVSDQIYLMLNGPKDFAAELAQLPEGVDLSRWRKAIRFDPERKRLIVDGSHHLLPNERDAILDQAPLIQDLTPEQQAQAKIIEDFHKAMEIVYARQSRLAFKERLAALLKGDPERVGILQKEKDGAVIEQRMGDIDHYKSLIDRYEANYARAQTEYQWTHLSQQWTELQQLRSQLVGPVKALDAELKSKATELLSESQLAAGPPPEPLTPIRQVNLKTMWGLTIIGALMIAGLFTRLSSLAGAGLLMMFYLAVPPWPGTPPEVGPEHNFIVNKVFVEATACLALAALPTGRWFGVDAIFAALLRRRKTED